MSQSNSQQSKPTAPPVIPPRTKTLVSSQAVLDSVADKPRHHLGDFVYEPKLKAGRLVPNASTQRGFASTPKPLPIELIKGKENCTLTVKIPQIHLTPAAREEITARAFLWGTDVYSDDSDVVAAAIHGGWIMGEWTDDVDTKMLELQESACDLAKRRQNKDQPQPALKPKNKEEAESLVTSPPQSGPMQVRANRDLQINVLILPRLVKYGSSTRFGVTSREFGGTFGERHAVHDGLSFMIRSIRWVENGGQAQARLRGQARRERMRKAMREVNASFGNKNGDLHQQIQGDVPSNWWKKETTTEKVDAPKAKEEDASEDKENKQETEAPKEVTEETAQAQDVEMAKAEKPAEVEAEAEA